MLPQPLSRAHSVVMSDGDQRFSTFETLPPEILTSIILRLADELADVIAAVNTSKTLRRVCHGNPAWIHILRKASDWCNAWLWQSESETAEKSATPAKNTPWAHTPEEVYNQLCTLGSSPMIPPWTFIQLIPSWSRIFLLYNFEMPRLTNAAWLEICIARFPMSIIRDYQEQRSAHEQVYSGREVIGSCWKEFFLRTIARHEHRSITMCAQEDNNCRYIIMHRKWGLTRNRSATREFVPTRVFREIVMQNNLQPQKGAFAQVVLAIPPTFTPTDLQVNVHITVGPDSFLRNHVMMTVLDKLTSWREQYNGQVILGPALICAKICKDEGRSRSLRIAGTSSASVYISLEIDDWFDICEKVGFTRTWWLRQCEVKDSQGYQ